MGGRSGQSIRSAVTVDSFLALAEGKNLTPVQLAQFLSEKTGIPFEKSSFLQDPSNAAVQRLPEALRQEFTEAGSAYFVVDGKKVRISDHELPDFYKNQSLQADYEIRLRKVANTSRQDYIRSFELIYGTPKTGTNTIPRPEWNRKYSEYLKKFKPSTSVQYEFVFIRKNEKWVPR